jgi:hypothetical protein
MDTTLGKIDEVRKRANVSYGEAKEALENCNGDVVEAIIYLENKKKAAEDKNKYGGDKAANFFNKIGELIEKGNRTRLVISKNEEVLISIPVTIAILITVLAPYVTVVGFLLALLTSHKVKVQGSGENCDKVNEELNKVSKVVEDIGKN